MKTKNTLKKSKSKSKRNPSPEDAVAVLRALTSSAATSFGFQSNTGDSVTKMPIDGVSISSHYVCRRLIDQAAATDSLRTTEDNLRFIEVFEMFRDLQPRNTLEAMLCTQMIGVHNLIMESTSRAILPEGGSAESNRVARLSKVFLEQAATRERLRGGFAQQHMTVEHIHVESGAKAVVGVVQIEESKNEPKSEL